MVLATKVLPNEAAAHGYADPSIDYLARACSCCLCPLALGIQGAIIQAGIHQIRRFPHRCNRRCNSKAAVTKGAVTRLVSKESAVSKLGVTSAVTTKSRHELTGT